MGKQKFKKTLKVTKNPLFTVRINGLTSLLQAAFTKRLEISESDTVKLTA